MSRNDRGPERQSNDALYAVVLNRFDRRSTIASNASVSFAPCALIRLSRFSQPVLTISQHLSLCLSLCVSLSLSLSFFELAALDAKRRGVFFCGICGICLSRMTVSR
jgi:hypothetical protein